MTALIHYRGLLAGMMVGLGGSSLPAQQSVQLYVTANPAEISPGGCTRITIEARDPSGQRYANVDGVQLYPTSFDYSIEANASSFMLSAAEPSAMVLCAQPNAGPVSTTVTATIKGTTHSGSAPVAIGGPAASVAPGQSAAAGAGAAAGGYGGQQQQPGAGGAAPASGGQQPAAAGGAAAYAGQQQPGAAGAAPGYGGQQQDAAAGAAAGGAAGYSGQQQPGSAPAGPGSSPAAAAGAPQQYAQGSQPTSGASVPGQPTLTPTSTAAGAPAAPVAATPAVGVAPTPPEPKGAGGFFKKLGKHLKQKAGEVANQTTENLASTAGQVVDATAQTGTNLVAGATAQVSSAARTTVGGIGKGILPLAGKSDNLAATLDAGMAEFRNKLFTGTTSVLEPAGKELLNQLAPELKARQGRFQIQFHLDPIPNALQITIDRAGVFRSGLINLGIDTTRFEVLGFGATDYRPQVPPDGGQASSERMVIVRVR